MISTRGCSTATPAAASADLVTFPAALAVLGFSGNTSMSKAMNEWRMLVQMKPRMNCRIRGMLTWAPCLTAQPYPDRVIVEMARKYQQARALAFSMGKSVRLSPAMSSMGRPFSLAVFL